MIKLKEILIEQYKKRITKHLGPKEAIAAIKKLNESGNLIVVDIQPEYEKIFGFKTYEFTEHIFNSDYDNIYYLYNGRDTLGMVSEDELKDWIMQNSDYSDEVYEKLEQIDFYDKGYAFFRYCIDEGISNDNIIALIKFMIEKDVNDSRDLNEEFWNEFIERYKEYLDLEPQEVRDLLEFSEDSINIPDLMDFLKKIKGPITLVGGGLEECLKEVIIALQVLEKPYKIDNNWTY